MQISKKQQEFLELMADPQITEILYGGSAGGGKSQSIGILIVTWAIRYPGIRFFVGRKTLKSLRQSTIETLIGKVLPAMGLTTEDYHMSWQNMELSFNNESIVIFGEVDYIPSDPTYSRIGSLECDIAILDEAGEISKLGKDAIRSRIGRGVLSNKWGIPGKIVLASNPDTGWLKNEYFDPYLKLGGGGFQKWQIGETTLNEGKDTEKKLPAYRAFLRASAYDNPFLPQSYIDNLKTLPDILRKKLLEGDWNYVDDDNMLFKAGLLDKATTYELPTGEGFESYIGVDVASTGGDRSVYTLVRNGTVITQKISSVQMNWDKNSDKPLFRLMADELIEFAMKNGFTVKEAPHIAIEGNGVGQALVSSIKERGWNVREFTATHKSRSENYNQLQLDFDSGGLKLYHEMNGLEDLRKELLAHTFEVNNQEISVEKKEKIKLRLGRSPDLADALAIANWCQHQNTDKLGERYNQARVIF